ncbi:MAG: hypothetical protein RLZZ106_1890, partial [Cyanobacteriota bacterium]
MQIEAQNPSNFQDANNNTTPRARRIQATGQWRLPNREP